MRRGRRRWESAPGQLIERRSAWEQEAGSEAESQPGGKSQMCQQCYFFSSAARNKSHILFILMAFLNEGGIAGRSLQSGQLMYFEVHLGKVYQHFSTLKQSTCQN